MKKRILTALILFVFTISFTGCNLDELNFMSTLNTMTSLTEVNFEGSIKFNVNDFSENENYVEDADPIPTSIKTKALLGNKILNKVKELSPLTERLFEEDTVLDDDIIEDLKLTMLEYIASINNYSGKVIIYNGSYSKINKKITLNISMKDSQEIVTPLFNMIFDDKTIYISKDFLDSILLEYTNEETINDVDYAKFTTDELLDMYFSAQKSIYEDLPTSFPGFDIPEDASGDFFSGYMDGFYIGLSDGYFNEETPTPTEGSADYLDGYDVGYAEGIVSGKGDRKDYDLNKDRYLEEIEKLDELQPKISEELNAENIITAMTSSKGSGLNEILGTLFKDFSLSLVKKDGFNKYVMDMTAQDMIDATSEAQMFLTENIPLLKTTMTSMVTNMPESGLGSLLFDADAKELELDIIDEMTEPTQLEIDESKTEIAKYFKEMKTKIAKIMDLNFSYSLEKTGSVSYESKAAIKMVTSPEDITLPFSMDIEVLFDLSINKTGYGDVKVLDNQNINNINSAKIKLDVTDENFVETGIYYSNNEDFSNPVMLKAIKQDDGSYVVDMTGLDPQVTYYYKSYTKDGAGNIVFSSVVKTFNSITNIDVAPATGDTSSPWPFIVFIAAAVIIAGVLFFLRKKN